MKDPAPPYTASWQQIDGEWMLRLSPVGRRRKLPARGELLEIEVERRDGAVQRLWVRVEDWLHDRKGQAYAALGRPEKRPKQPAGRTGPASRTQR